MPGRNAVIALETDGLKEAVAALDYLTKLDVNKALKAEFRKLAEMANAKAHANASTRLERKAAETLAVHANASSSTLAFGRGFDGAFGAEFGAMHNLHRLPHQRPNSRQRLRAKLNARHSTLPAGKGFVLGWNQFPQWTGSDNQAGMFVWPGIRAAVEENIVPMQEAIDQIFQGVKHGG